MKTVTYFILHDRSCKPTFLHKLLIQLWIEPNNCLSFTNINSIIDRVLFNNLHFHASHRCLRLCCSKVHVDNGLMHADENFHSEVAGSNKMRCSRLDHGTTLHECNALEKNWTVIVLTSPYRKFHKN